MNFALDIYGELWYYRIKSVKMFSVMNMSKRTALYLRLSKDDEQQGESNSIVNQRKLLEQYAQEHFFANLHYYIDDGYSGTTFDRPQIQQLFEDIQNGLVETVIVKDLSRFGRNHLMVGYYSEILFREQDVRFISVLDGVDSNEGENDLTAFKNILNEWYAKDISKKQRASVQARGNSGKRLCANPPIGYMKGSDGQWYIDEPRAAIVRRIFQMYLDGTCIAKIARILTDERIPSPGQSDNWYSNTIRFILSNQAYCGDTVNFKTQKVSFKSSKQVARDPSDHLIFRNTHEAIIDRKTWDKTQRRLQIKKRAVPHVLDKNDIYTGFLVCADCGSRLYSRLARQRDTFYLCSSYAKSKSSIRPCTAHYTPDHVIEKRVLNQIRSLLDEYKKDKSGFTIRLSGFQSNSLESEIRSKTKLVGDLENQVKRIELILKQVYEDKLTGVLDEESFQILYRQYIEERASLVAVMQQLQKELIVLRSTVIQNEQFIQILEKYADQNLRHVTLEILYDFIEKIVVHESPPHSPSSHKQLDIFFHAVGCIDNFTK